MFPYACGEFSGTISRQQTVPILQIRAYNHIMSASILQRMDKKENTQSSRNSIRSLKSRSHRVLKPTNSPNSQAFNDRQISDQLSQEFTHIAQTIEIYTQRRKTYPPLSKSRTVVQELFSLEETILSRDHEIKAINDEIKGLKIAKYKHNEPSEEKKTLNEAEMFKLAQELKRQRLAMTALIESHAQKMGRLAKLREALQKMEVLYMKRFGEKAVTYAEFKDKIQEAKREEQLRRKKHPKEIRIGPIKEKLETSMEMAINKPDGNSKTMKELQNRKLITEAALKNARKKHLAEIAELNAKLEFLRDEDALLKEKIEEKEVEKAGLETRFNNKGRGGIKVHMGNNVEMSPMARA